MEKIFSALLRRVRQSTSAATGWVKKSPPQKRAAKQSFEEWKALNPHGTLKEYTAKLPFEEWQALNPKGTFKEYYVAGVLDALAGKKTHANLGPLTCEGSLERAEVISRTLVSLGVTRSEVVVDYGCGTLRVGKSLIEYLEPSRYVGLDIDRRILDTGLALLPEGLAKQKTPIVDVINDEALDRIALLRPGWIFSKGVLHHVPPSDVGEFFGNISRLAHTGTKILIWARLLELGNATIFGENLAP